MTFPIFHREEKTQNALLETLFEQSFVALIAVSINSTVYVFLSWKLVNHAHLLAWLAVIISLTIFRTYLHAKWLRYIGLRHFKAMMVKFNCGVFISGLLWGWLGGFFLNTSSNTHLALTTFILAGMTAGALTAYSASMLTARLFVFPALIPTIVRLAIEPTMDHRLMAFMCFVYLTMMDLLGRSLNKLSTKTILLSTENKGLAQRVSDASHELRTPLVAVSGFSELLLEQGHLEGKFRDYAEIILKNSQRLQNLVDRILMLGRAESENNVIECEPISVKDELNEICKIIEPDLTKKGLKISLKQEDSIPDIVFGDAQKIRQIILNLLSNAIKFTDRGRVTMDLHLTEENLLVGRVTDTGVGISRESISKIFNPFFRENRPEIKKQVGSGLGLSLCLKLAESLGGYLKLVETNPGEGSTFEFGVKVSTSMLT